VAIDKNFKIKNGLTVGDVEIVSSTGEWVGPSSGLVGPPGPPGYDGTDGVDGMDGAPGMNGYDGMDGVDGLNGLSAYESALANGFIGTEQEWLQSIFASGAVAGNIKVGVDSFDTINTVSTNLVLDSATGLTILNDNVDITGNLIIDGNFTVSGTTTTLSATNLAVSDNMIYMNQAIATTISDVVGNGTDVVYTTNESHNYLVGYSVSINGIDPSAYNLSNQTITAITSNTFTVANSATGTYVSGGTARGRSNSNPDLGIAFGYYDGSYQHGGFFRDATDTKFKVFKGYTPEPDSSAFIDTADPTFALADIQAENFHGALVGNADTSTSIAGGSSNQITYQSDVGITSFISAPSTTNTYLKWNGSSFTWDGVDGSLPNNITSSAYINPSLAAAQYNVNELAVGTVFGIVNGTPKDGQKLTIRIKDNGTQRTLGWDSIWRPIGTTLPTTTVANKIIYVGAIYNSYDAFWDVVSVAQQA
jgi:hypothetical protein